MWEIIFKIAAIASILSAIITAFLVFDFTIWSLICVFFIVLACTIWSLIHIRRKSKKFKRPKESIIIKDFNFTDKKSTWWRYAEIGGCQSMVVCGVFRIESISDCETYLTAIRMKKPRFYGNLMVEGADYGKGIYGNQIILNRSSDSKGKTTMIFTFHITPAVIESENKFAPEKKEFEFNLEIFDQFGNKHKRKNVEFRFDDNQKFSDLDIVSPYELNHFKPDWAEKMKSGAEKRYSHS